MQKHWESMAKFIPPSLGKIFLLDPPIQFYNLSKSINDLLQSLLTQGEENQNPEGKKKLRVQLGPRVQEQIRTTLKQRAVSRN